MAEQIIQEDFQSVFLDMAAVDLNKKQMLCQRWQTSAQSLKFTCCNYLYLESGTQCTSVTTVVIFLKMNEVIFLKMNYFGLLFFLSFFLLLCHESTTGRQLVAFSTIYLCKQQAKVDANNFGRLMLLRL